MQPHKCFSHLDLDSECSWRLPVIMNYITMCIGEMFIISNAFSVELKNSKHTSMRNDTQTEVTE